MKVKNETRLKDATVHFHVKFQVTANINRFRRKLLVQNAYNGCRI